MQPTKNIPPLKSYQELSYIQAQTNNLPSGAVIHYFLSLVPDRLFWPYHQYEIS